MNDPFNCMLSLMLKYAWMLSIIGHKKPTIAIIGDTLREDDASRSEYQTSISASKKSSIFSLNGSIRASLSSIINKIAAVSRETRIVCLFISSTMIVLLIIWWCFHLLTHFGQTTNEKSMEHGYFVFVGFKTVKNVSRNCNFASTMRYVGFFCFFCFILAAVEFYQQLLLQNWYFYVCLILLVISLRKKVN